MSINCINLLTNLTVYACLEGSHSINTFDFFFLSVLQHLEVVRPLVQLLDVQNTGLQNFEALMALTNLASMNDAVRSVSCLCD